MMELQKLELSAFEERCCELALERPIEQSEIWVSYQELIEGRSFYGAFELVSHGSTKALMCAIDYKTHGYHYLRVPHGPVWVTKPEPEEERAAADAIYRYLKAHDKKILFVRMSSHTADAPFAPVLSGVPYDQTVVVDLSGTDEDILSRMKPRGRRDVRKALREAPITCVDETVMAAVDFAPYYEVMVETGGRDGFVAAPLRDYQNLMQVLGPEHARLFAGRDAEGKLACWSLATCFEKTAQRLYAASKSSFMRGHVADKLLFFECCELARLGCVCYDLAGIGSEFCPELLGVAEFKRKFAKEVTSIAPERDLPVQKLAYKALCAVKDLRDRALRS